MYGAIKAPPSPGIRLRRSILCFFQSVHKLEARLDRPPRHQFESLPCSAISSPLTEHRHRLSEKQYGQPTGVVHVAHDYPGQMLQRCGKRERLHHATPARYSPVSTLLHVVGIAAYTNSSNAIKHTLKPSQRSLNYGEPFHVLVELISTINRDCFKTRTHPSAHARSPTPRNRYPSQRQHKPDLRLRYRCDSQSIRAANSAARILRYGSHRTSPLA